MEATITAEELMLMHPNYKAFFELGFQDDRDDLVYKEYSVKKLMYEYNMSFPGAVLLLHQIEEDYEGMTRLLAKGIK